MKTSRIYTIFVIAALFVIFGYTISGMKFSNNYPLKIEEERKEKDETFKNGEESPLTEEQKEQFSGLNYYPVDEKYKVKAVFSLNPKKEKIKLTYTDGSRKTYLKYGFATFELEGIPQKVAILKPVFFEDEEYLFLPFYDETSALETYGGGRYLDLEPDPDDFITLDFNRAYNPYCAYNAEYRCPIPPKENKITIAIKAGEKIY